jgi:hypothetical protein
MPRLPASHNVHDLTSVRRRSFDDYIADELKLNLIINRSCSEWWTTAEISSELRRVWNEWQRGLR